MNNVFRLIWNRTLGRLVVASEAARSRNKAATQQGVVGQLSAPAVAGGAGISTSLRPMVVGVALAAGSLLLLAPAQANTVNTTTTCMTNLSGTVGQENPGTTSSQAQDGSGTYSTVTGCDASGKNQLAATVYGAFSEVTGTGGAVFGFNSSAAKWATALGLESQATGIASIALGFGGQATGLDAIAIGTEATAGESSVAMGSGAYAFTSDAPQNMGGYKQGDPTSAVAIGQDAFATGGTAIGDQAWAAYPSSNGQDPTGEYQYATALGAGARAEGWNALAIGVRQDRPTIASGDGAVAMGNWAVAEGDDSAVAIGQVSSAKGASSIALGWWARAENDNAIAMGRWAHATANGISAISVGDGAFTDGQDAIAIGTGATASGDQSISIGTGNQVSGDGSGAIGDPSIIDAANSYSVGNNNTLAAGADNSFVLGNDVNIGANISEAVALGNASGVTEAGGVALGANSVASTAGGLQGYNPTTGVADGLNAGIAATQSTAAAVSVGDDVAGVYRQITGVAAGTQDSDAVNVAQLKASETHYYSVNSTDTSAGSNYANDGATGQDALAAGVRATAASARDIAIGHSAETGDVAGATLAQNDNVAIGSGAKALGGTSVAIGEGATATGSGTGFVNSVIAIGRQATASDYGALALGSGANTGVGAEYSAAIGPRAMVGDNAYNSIAIGNEAKVTNGSSSSTAVGRGATINSTGSVAVGVSATVASGASSSTVVGRNATVNSSNSVAIGRDAGVAINSQRGTAIGSAAKVLEGAESGVAIGDGAVVSAQNAIAMGTVAQATGQHSIAIGYDAIATGSVAMGASARAGNGGAAFGDGAVATYNGGVNDPAIVAGAALGENSNADVSGATALGTDATVTHEDSVALGQGSIADGSTLSTAAYQPLDVNGDPIAVAAPTADSEVSVGSAGAERRITNVAAGATDTDAVNVSQLKAVEQVASQGWQLTANGEATGENIAPGEAADFSAGKNIAITRTGNSIAVATADDVEFNQVTIGDTTNNTVLTSTVDGLDVGGDKITNVQAGDVSNTSTDAVNGSQLFATNENVATNTTNITNNATEIAKGFNIAADNGTDDNVQLGDTVNYTSGDSNIVTTVTDNQIDFGLASSISVGTSNPVTIDGDAGTIGGLTNTTFDPNNFTSGQAASEDQLKQVSDVANAGWNVQTTDDSAAPALSNVAPNKNVDFVSSDDNVAITHTQDANGDTQVDYTLSNELTVGEAGPAGEDGYIGVDGKDGISGVAINGKDGSIGLTGPSGTNGTISVIDGKAGVNGVDGVDGITRIVIDDIEVATMEDGLKFSGNDNPADGFVTRKLNEEMQIVGGAQAKNADGTDSAYSSDNIRTVATQDGGIEIQLAESPTFGGDLTVEGDTYLGDNFSVVNNEAFYDGPINNDNSVVNKQYVDGLETHYYSVNDNGTQGGNYDNDGATGVNALAAGVNALADDADSVAVGSGAHATGGNADGGAVAVGYIATANGDGATAIGSETIANADGATAIGDDANALARFSTSVGDGAEVGALSITGVAIGTEATVSGLASGGVAVGPLANVSALNGAAFGAGARATVLGGIALGSGSVADTAAGESGYVPTGALAADAAAIAATDSTLRGAVSVGSAGNTRQITNVAAGTQDSDAVNVAQLKAVNEVANQGFNITADNSSLATAEDNVKLGETVDYTSADSNIVTTLGENEIDFGLADNLVIGDDTAPGSIIVKGEDGVDGAVGINGKNGTIGLTGPMGPDGAPAATIGVADGVPGVTGEPGVDGITRIVYEGTDQDGNPVTETVATLSDGLRFSGNDNPADGFVTRKLNEEMQIVGGAQAKNADGTDSAYSSDNIRTVATQDGGIEIQLAESPTFGGDLTVEGDTYLGDTYLGDNFSVVNNEAFYDGPITENTHIVNKEYVDNQGDASAGGGFGLADATDTEVKQDLGKTIKVHDPDGNVITTADNANGELQLSLSNDLTVGEAGPAGEDGYIGVDGKDGVSGVAINGKDGSIGLTGPSGTNGTISVIDGKAGVNGVDGVDGITRIVIDDIEVATMEDGLKFSGNDNPADGFVTRKLNEEMQIVGGAKATNADGTDSEYSSDNIRTVATQDGGIEIQLAESPTFGGDLTVEGDTYLGDNFSVVNNEAFYDGPITENTHIVNKEYVDNQGDASAGGGFGLADATDTEVKQDLGKTIKVHDPDGNIVTVADNATGELQLSLSNDLAVGEAGPAGEDGYIGVDGKDGVSGVAINGKDGSIGLTGPSGTNGTISVIDGKAGVNGVDGVDGITRIVIDDIEVATMEDGLKFSGNDNPADGFVTRKLNEELRIVGGAQATNADGSPSAYSSDNIRTVATQDGGIEIQLAESPTFGGDLTVEGDTYLGDNFSVVNNEAFYDGSITENTHIVNKEYVDNQGDASAGGGFGLADAMDTEVKQDLGATIKVHDPDGDIITTADNANGELQLSLSNDLSVGGPGADGADGEDGYIGVDGKDGKTGVAIDGADGSIGLTGPAGADGNSPVAIISPENLPGDVVADSTNVTRLTFEDGDGNSKTLATLEDDGLRFSGNDNSDTADGFVTRRLNEEMQIVGGAQATNADGTDSEYSSDNIRTVATQDGGIEIQLAESPTFGGDLTVEGDTYLGDNFSVVNNEAFYDGPITENTHIVNKEYVDNQGDASAGGGFGLADATDTEVKQDLGATIKVHDPDGDIITTADNANGELQLSLSNDLSVGGPGADGADGEDGYIGVDGKDGKTGVAIDGADGSIGLTGPAGADGNSPVAIISPENLPGDVVADSTNVTRLTFEDGDGNSKTLATLEDDGLRFSGNDNSDTADGFVTRRLNEEMQIVGGAKATNADGTDSEYSSDNIRTVATQDGGIEIQLAESPTFGGDLTVEGDTYLGDNFSVVNNEAIYNVEPDQITNDYSVVNKKYVDNQGDASAGGGFGFADATDTEVKQDLGATIKVHDPDGDIITTADNANGELQLSLSNDLSVGGPGADGADGEDGYIGVDGKDGKTGVAIDGADGSIGLTGPAGADGKNPVAIISPENLPGDVVADSTNVTRLTFEDGDGNSKTLATLEDDGLRFSGNDNSDTADGFVTRRLNEEMQIVGGAQATNADGSESEYSSDNIRTVATQDGGIEIQLAESPTFGGDLTVEGDTYLGDNFSVVNNEAHYDGAITENTHIVNKEYVDNTVSGVTDTPLTFGADEGEDTERRLGDRLDLVGEADDEGHSNIITKLSNDETLELALNDDLQVSNSITVGESGPVISVEGVDMNDTKITNLAAGDVSADSKDAVNGSQLYQLESIVTNVTGDISNEYITENGLGIRYVRTNDSGLAVSDAFAQGEGSTAVGYEAVASADRALAMGYDAIASHQGSVALGEGARTAEAVGTASVDIAGQTYQFAGASPVATVSVGSVGSERTITNVAAGRITADSTDAINGSQLYAAMDFMGSLDDRLTIVEGDTGGGGADGAVMYDRDDNGDINYDSVTLAGEDGTKLTNVADGDISNDSSDAINGSQLHDTNQNVANNTTNIVDNSQRITNNEGNIADNSQRITTNENSITDINETLGLGLNFGADEGDTVNRQLGDTVAITGDDNITTKTTDDGVQITMNRDLDVDSVTTGNTTVNNDGVSIKDGPSMTVNGIDAGGTTITNVAPGVNEGDAVNVGQMNELGRRFQNEIVNVHGRIDSVERNANAGSASAIAASTVPQAWMPGKSMIGVGAGTYGGESAVSVGISRLSDNGRWVIQGKVTGDSQSNFGAGIGAGWHW